MHCKSHIISWYPSFSQASGQTPHSTRVKNQFSDVCGRTCAGRRSNFTASERVGVALQFRSEHALHELIATRMRRNNLSLGKIDETNLGKLMLCVSSCNIYIYITKFNKLTYVVSFINITSLNEYESSRKIGHKISLIRRLPDDGKTSAAWGVPNRGKLQKIVSIHEVDAHLMQTKSHILHRPVEAHG